jgi:MYXO-CTERM domain-containing protein
MLETGLGGPNDYGTSCLSYNDDGSSVAIPLEPAFGAAGLNFFGMTHRTMYVNTNGNITFSGPVSTYTPDAFPLRRTMPTPMIAPYWTDIDNRGTPAGGGFGCQNPSTDGNDWGLGMCRMSPGEQNGIYWQLQPGRAVVTWDRVGYFNCHDDLRMTFQLILTRPPDCSAEGDFDVEFRFTQCEWTTGDASMGTGGFGGTPAQAGFDAGNGRDFVQIPGSRMAGINDVMCDMSNVSRPGVWQFQIRAGSVVCPGAGDVCDTGMPGVCAEGRQQCVGSGTMCRPVVASSAERCDGLDNNCNGSVDEETAMAPICAPGAVCRTGQCIDACFDGACDTGYECEPGTNLCVPAGCSGVRCEDGERCMAGVCGGACAGITCPAGLDCREGRCLNLCEGLTCDDCSVCESGTCEDKCPAVPCGAGLECTPEGRCVPTGCVGMTCEAGFTCTATGCVDACIGTVCPLGEICQVGACVAPPPLPDAGMPDAGPVVDAGPPADAYVPPILADAGEVCNRRCQMERELAMRGCGCSVPSNQTSSSTAMWMALGALGLVLASRRRRS